MEFIALLFIATLYGGMVLYSFGFAALLFKVMPVGEARMMLRRAFPYYYLFTIAVAALSGVLALALDTVSAVLLGITALISVYARQVLMQQINRASDDDAAGKEGAKRRFDLLHGISISLQLLQIGIVAYVLWRFL